MNVCPLCNLPKSYDWESGFQCGSFYNGNGMFVSSVACRKIVSLQEMLFKSLYYVRGSKDNELTQKIIDEIGDN